MKIALITGITGQDGSYLAEILLEKEYIVYGIVRRSSDINTKRIDHLYANKNLVLKYGDLSDSACILGILNEIKTKYEFDVLEIYNLGAMSHVKVSFELPEYTGNVDGLGTLRLLEGVKATGLIEKTRFYQASTSELYGKVQEVPQTEKTPFYPRSPYGVAKLYGFWITKNYRESYDMFAANGILFNHETLAAHMPLIYKKNGIIDIKPVSEIVKYDTLNEGQLVDENKKTYQEGCVETDLCVWDNNDWTKVKFASGYPHDVVENNKKPKFLISKNSAYMVTGEHVIIMDDGSEKKCEDIEINDKVKLIDFPTNLLKRIEIDEIEAEFLGLMVRDGNVKKMSPHFKNKDINQIEHIIELWNKVCRLNGKNANHNLNRLNNGSNKVVLNGFNDFSRKYNIYNEDNTKRVPYQILNADKTVQESFLKGYNRIENFKTNSATLAQGLIYLLKNTNKQNFNINVESVRKNKLYYNVNTHHLECQNNKIKKIIDLNDYDGWFYDLETESGTFHAGIGLGRIHNSPRRGPTFVTRKITRGLNMILKGERDRLVMGNLDAKRDWGYAKDYCEGMWRILQADKPDDYVLATNEFHSVREFIEKAFALKGFNIKWKGSGLEEVGYDEKTGRELIFVSENYFRPAEVEELLGDSTKAREELGWEPKCSFDELVKLMVDEDCK